jgi:uncharacterized membrane protein
MAHAENLIVINKPVSEVFGFLADGLNNPKWRAGVVDIKLKSGAAGRVGAEYRQVLKGPFGRNIDGDYRLLTVNQDKELKFVVTSGPARPTGEYLFEQQGGSTKLTFVLDYQTKGLAKLMEPMIQRTMNSEVAALSKLKQVLEST